MRKSYVIPAIIACIICAVGIWFVFVGYPVETYRDQRVRAGKMWTLVNIISPHSPADSYVEVNGKRFRRVLGLPPFYIQLPQSHWILFVTGDGSGRITFHLSDPRARDVTAIDGGKVNFGGHIGSKRAPGEAYTDFIEKETSNELVLASRYPRARTRLFVDLTAKRLDHIEYEEFGEDGQVAKHQIYKGPM